MSERRTSTPSRIRLRAVVAVLTATTLAAVGAGCSSDDDAGDRTTTTAPGSSTTGGATTTTLSDADYRQKITELRAGLTASGTDTCKVLSSLDDFSRSAALSAPANPQQTEEALRLAADMFRAAAASAPPGTEAAAQELTTAADALLVDGQEAGWAPEWFRGFPASDTGAQLQQAVQAYFTEVQKVCRPAEPTSTTG